jgi:hypothetical protein
MIHSFYLGDGAYASVREDDNAVVITTGHHDPEQADNVVYLEPPVFEGLISWARRIGFLREERR